MKRIAGSAAPLPSANDYFSVTPRQRLSRSNTAYKSKGAQEKQLERCGWRKMCRTLGPVSRRSRKVFPPGKPQQNHSNLLNTKQCYSHVLNMNRGFLHTRGFRRIHLSVFRKRLPKNAFASPKSFRGSRERGPVDS